MADQKEEQIPHLLVGARQCGYCLVLLLEMCQRKVLTGSQYSVHLDCKRFDCMLID